MLLTTIRSSWLRIPWWLLSLCFIAIFVGNIDMLIALITYLASFSIVILMFAMIVLVALHVYIHFLTWCNIDSFRYRLIWHVGSLACISSWSSLSMMYICITFHPIVIACMCAWVEYPTLYLTACYMTALPLHDCMSLVYVGRTSIPLSPTFLVSIIPFIPVLTIASVRPSMCLLFDRARD